MIDLLLRWGFRMDIGQKIAVSLRFQETGKQSDLLVIEAVMRHLRVWREGGWITKPLLQPLRLYLAANPGQLRSEVAAHEVAGRVLRSVARGAERFPIDRC